MKIFLKKEDFFIGYCMMFNTFEIYTITNERF